MKRLYKNFLVAAFFITFNSCDESTIDLAAPFASDEEFFSNEDEFQAAVFGIYQKLQNFYTFNVNDPIHEVWLMPGDNATTESGRLVPFNNFREISTTDVHLEQYYKLSYQLIARANTVLEKLEERGSEVFDDQSLAAYNRGEALFLRGLMFTRLWHFYGTAPLITEVIDNTEAPSVTNSSGTQLLDAAIEDLQAASQLLPPSWPDDLLGRATSGAAFGLLGKVLAYRGLLSGNNSDYLSAITAFSSVTGYSLLADFGANFDETAENNAESLFEVQFSRNSLGNNYWLLADVQAGNGDVGGTWVMFDERTDQRGIPRVLATPALMNLFEPGDPRVPETYDPATGNVLKYVNRGNTSGNPGSFNNARILRYSDVLLMHAWAIAESGGSLAQAIGLVNQVRTRAREFGGAGSTVPADYPTTETDRATVLGWIIDERRMELAFEESHRWFDLRILHLTDRIDLQNYDFGDPSTETDFDSNELVYPFPANEVEVTDLNQNENY